MFDLGKACRFNSLFLLTQTLQCLLENPFQKAFESLLLSCIKKFSCSHSFPVRAIATQPVKEKKPEEGSCFRMKSVTAAHSAIQSEVLFNTVLSYRNSAFSTLLCCVPPSACIWKASVSNHREKRQFHEVSGRLSLITAVLNPHFISNPSAHAHDSLNMLCGYLPDL